MNAPTSLAQMMALATALTREGRVAEATQTIQEALRLHRGADARPPSAPAMPTLEGVVLDGLVREVEAPAPVATPDATAEAEAPTRPAAPPGRARFEARTSTTEQGQRQFKLYLPASLSPDTRAPLVVMLHGCKQNPDDFAAGTRMNELAEEQGFRVLYPAQAQRSNASRCWNWFQSADQRRGRGEPELLATMVRQVMHGHAVNPGEVYVAGLSAGGAMAAILATEYPDLFAAAGVHSGLPPGAAHDMPSAFAAMKQGPQRAAARAAAAVPMIVFHGDRDDTVHPRNGEQLVPPPAGADTERGRATGGRAYVRTVHRDDEGKSVAEHWVVQGMGHAWSGGSPAGSYTEPRGPDASREMLRFFAQHRRGSGP
jgi:poly(hydroxyalkanoate) depolymerase family esterase